ncbi:MAG: hypothetical protein KAU38_15385, partial [Desulfobacterales bacterium]|nr:hypothetical protein [Desulfobacterales bacterium]
LDPHGLKSSQPHMERVIGLLNFIHRCETKEYIAMSKIISNKPISNRLMSQITKMIIENPHECPEGPHLAILDTNLVALSRGYATHSISAYEQHRYLCQSILHSRQSSLRRTDLAMKNDARVYLANDANGKGWRHDAPKTNLSDHFHKIRQRIDSPSFVEALEALHDNPERSVRLLCDVFEREFGKTWPVTCSQIYIKFLNRELRRELVIGVNVKSSKKQRFLDPPKWLEGFDEKGKYISFSELANAVDIDEVHNDYLFSERVRGIDNKNYSYVTPEIISELIILAKGIRNIVVHSGVIPVQLRNPIQYLAKLLLILFDLVSYESYSSDV